MGPWGRVIRWRASIGTFNNCNPFTGAIHSLDWWAALWRTMTLLNYTHLKGSLFRHFVHVWLEMVLSQGSTEFAEIASNGVYATFDSPEELKTSFETPDGV